MKSSVKKLGTFIVAAALFTACSKDDKPNNGGGGSQPKYVVMTMSERVPAKPGYISAFDSPLEAVSFSNIVAGKSLQGQGMGGIRTYKNSIFKMFNTSANEKGIEKISVSADNVVSTGKFLKTGNAINGSGNFVIETDTKGYYWDCDAPWEINVFNPETVARTGSLGVYENLKKDEEGILFQGIGQHFLAIKGGKLFADITYSKTGGAQSGMFGSDYFDDVYVAVIDLPTGNYEKTITIENTGGIAYVNENEMYSFDSNGDLYILCQGRSAIGGKSKIVRIKAASTDIDQDWLLDENEVNDAVDGKFTMIYVKDGKLITLLTKETLTTGQTGNINNENIWEYFVFDVNTKAKTKITGVPAVTNPGAAYGVVELDGKTLLRVSTVGENGENSYYELNGTAATKWLSITEGGSLSGIYKIEL